MSLVLTEDQSMLQDAARNFCAQHSPVSVLRRLRDEKDEKGYDEKIWKQMVELGWTGMALPEAYGGFDFGYSGLGIVLEQTGKSLASSPLISSVLLGATAVNLCGNEEQKQALLPEIVAGELLLALAIDESPFHRPTEIALSATKQDDHYVLNGQKTFVVDGHIADRLIVVARTSADVADRKGISLFLVDSRSQGVLIERTSMLDSRNYARISFDQVRTPIEDLLGAEHAACDMLEQVLDIGRIGVAAEMLGSITQVFEQTVEYLKQREQFGVLIGAFQALQHRAAIMYSEIELCKSVVRAALAALDNPESEPIEIARLASLAKAKLSEVFELVSNEGVQMHGGIGMTDEFDIGFYLKRARVAQQFLGDASFHRDRYASLHDF
jgi:alkylation response protein AidB-like acyl-CoA dehydrogenase